MTDVEYYLLVKSAFSKAVTKMLKNSTLTPAQKREVTRKKNQLFWMIDTKVDIPVMNATDFADLFEKNEFIPVSLD